MIIDKANCFFGCFSVTLLDACMARRDGQKSEFKFTNLRIEIQKIVSNNSFFVIV